MKKIIVLLAVAASFTACKKENAETCWVCQHRDNNQNFGYEKCGEKPAPSFVNAQGQTVFVTCVKK